LIDSYISTEDLLALDLQVAADATTALLAIFEGLTTAQKKRLIIYLEVLTIVWTAYENNVLSGNWPAVLPVAKIHIPAKGFGQPDPPPEDEMCTGLEPLTIDSVRCPTVSYGWLVLICHFAAVSLP
jgi:hypothetical protein